MFPRSNITADSLSADTKLVLGEVTQSQLRKITPILQAVTVFCLKAIRTLQKFCYLPNNPAVFRSYAAYGNYVGKLHVSLVCYFLHKGSVIPVSREKGFYPLGVAFFDGQPKKCRKKSEKKKNGENRILPSNCFRKLEKEKKDFRIWIFFSSWTF